MGITKIISKLLLEGVGTHQDNILCRGLCFLGWWSTLWNNIAPERPGNNKTIILRDPYPGDTPPRPWSLYIHIICYKTFFQASIQVAGLLLRCAFSPRFSEAPEQLSQRTSMASCLRSAKHFGRWVVSEVCCGWWLDSSGIMKQLYPIEMEKEDLLSQILRSYFLAPRMSSSGIIQLQYPFWSDHTPSLNLL